MLAIDRGIVAGGHRVLTDGREVHVPQGLQSAAIASDAHVVAGAGQSRGAFVWDARDGTELGRVETGEGQLELALSADGTTLITRGDERIARWDVASGSQRWSVRGDGRAPLALSPDGSRVAVAGARGLLLDAATGEELAPLADGVTLVAFSHDGTRLALADTEGSVWVVNPRTGAVIARLPHSARVTALRWAQDGEQLVTGTTAGTLAAWAGDFQPAPRRHLAQFVADDTRAVTTCPHAWRSTRTLTRWLGCWRARGPAAARGRLLGEWGSGKSFFMRRLKRRVAELASDARDSGELQKYVAWHKRIVRSSSTPGTTPRGTCGRASSSTSSATCGWPTTRTRTSSSAAATRSSGRSSRSSRRSPTPATTPSGRSRTSTRSAPRSSPSSPRWTPRTRCARSRPPPCARPWRTPC